jgi:cation transport ATPase
MSTASPAISETERRDLVVTGMTCASCVTSVEDALKSVPGVRAADVNLATERARVELSAATADAALVRAVERAGYGALVLSRDREERAGIEAREREARAAHLRSLGLRLAVAATLAIAATSSDTSIAPRIPETASQLTQLSSVKWFQTTLNLPLGALNEKRTTMTTGTSR